MVNTLDKKRIHMNGERIENPKVQQLSSKLHELQKYDDKEPKDMIDSTSGIQSKWRRGWYTSVIGFVMLFEDLFVENQEIINTAKEYQVIWAERARHNPPYKVTREDIKQMDGFIDETLDFLRKRK